MKKTLYIIEQQVFPGVGGQQGGSCGDERIIEKKRWNRKRKRENEREGEEEGMTPSSSIFIYFFI